MTLLITGYIAVIILSTCLAVLIRRRLAAITRVDISEEEELPTYTELLKRIDEIEATQRKTLELLKSSSQEFRKVTPAKTLTEELAS